MGNCCSGNANEGEIQMKHGPNYQKLNTMLFDDREVLGLRGQDKLKIIVRIQALFRGALSRRRVE
jgi:hypothetical protein